MSTISASRRVVLGWVLVGVLLTAMHAMWSLAIPQIGSPDEQSHVARAAAVARGQWSGELGPPPTDGVLPGAPTIVSLPSDYLAVLSLPNCFAFQPDQPASCQPGLPPAGPGDVDVEITAGQYPPLYYALVGWPSLFLSAGPSIYAMRLVSGLLASMLLIWGAFRMRSLLPAPQATWAIFAAITPMCLFLGAMVNPQALEISAGFAFWAACLALARSSGPPRGAVLIQAGITGALLVNSRADGPLWAAVAVVVALILAPRGRWRVLIAARAMWWTAALAGIASALAAMWLLSHAGPVTLQGMYPQYGRPIEVVRFMLPHTYDYLMQMVGNFGWLDNPSPWTTTVPYSLAIGALLLLAMAIAASNRDRAALLLAMLTVVAGPIVLQIPTAEDAGMIWQGRYILPMAVGVPLVAAVMLDGLDAAATDIVRRIARWIVPLLGAAQFAAFWSALRRYSEGYTGKWLTWSPAWSSPVGYLSAVIVYGLLVTGLTAVAWRSLLAAHGAAESTPSAEATEPEQAAPRSAEDISGEPTMVLPAHIEALGDGARTPARAAPEWR